ncbi:D-methionine transport system ATP-binding protein [Actinoplanes lutulentus]|uniref:D-methionine transport system ATP-binding protein n=1 Tax=Actinoplanes lutulentus TaxID=1287878 RepID=A0A327ZKQ2_9ACTN|nr:ATP-binding cassette domain-containing protein [Actinoplanes lutulentus]MBB2944181.1 D-methionine transport system ATP-binding protein [Actinoplanes lutulentus]RAK42586.1 D-methionine transport system ATP-binding protein [Actinoplanes lutulentus]
MIEIRGLRKTYRSRKQSVNAVDNVDLTVGEGEVYGVLGQSGAGKSTLLRCVNMLERPDTGTVAVDGVELTALGGKRLRIARHGIGMIHQHFALLSSRTVAGNVAFALEVTGAPRAERRARVAELLELVGLSGRADAYPSQLSGGQKQRVGIARALAARPKVLLSDEATSALDPETTDSILRLLLDLNRRLGLTILLITHEMTVVKRICTSAAVMRDGKFVESGRVADLLRRDSELARDLFPLDGPSSVDGSAVLDVTVSGDDADKPLLAEVARRFDTDVRILAGHVETLAATRAGRWRIAVPTAASEDAADFLRKSGAQVGVAS